MPEIPKIYPVRPGLEAVRDDIPEAIERFRQSRIKIAVQRDGELTELSRSVFLERYGVYVPRQDPNSRLLVNSSEDGEYGFLYARNKDICDLVASGAVDMALIGTDRLIEDQAEDRVEVVESFRELGLWALTIATPETATINSVEQLRTVATKYPVITTRFLESLQVKGVEIISTAGGTEIYPYLDYGGHGVDAIVDLTVSGNSLAAHGLMAWDPPIAQVYPILIRTKPSSEQQE